MGKEAFGFDTKGSADMTLPSIEIKEATTGVFLSDFKDTVYY